MCFGFHLKVALACGKNLMLTWKHRTDESQCKFHRFLLLLQRHLRSIDNGLAKQMLIAS